MYIKKLVFYTFYLISVNLDEQIQVTGFTKKKKKKTGIKHFRDSYRKTYSIKSNTNGINFLNVIP